MSTSSTILSTLDKHLASPVELTLYGRAALQLGFPEPPEEFALTRDVDAVLWLGQAEQLLASTNFWEAVDVTNTELRGQELYISHFFTEDQVILLPTWRENRIAIPGPWRSLRLSRLGDRDLLLSKLMRDDPIDRADALFVVRSAGLGAGDIRQAIAAARLPASPEIREQFEAATARLLAALR